MWMFDYFVKELGIQIISSNELVIERNGKKFYLHHGDGLGPGDSKVQNPQEGFQKRVLSMAFCAYPPKSGCRNCEKMVHA